VYKGKHLLVDCQNVKGEVCLDDEKFLKVMARAAERAGAKVVSQIRYKFGHDSPAGFAAVVMLDESHCSAHTYADLNLVALDIFTCGNTEPRSVLQNIREELDLGDIEVRELPRFGMNRETARQVVSAHQAWQA
jgi:S-adenosylmethionine decarboxylase